MNQSRMKLALGSVAELDRWFAGEFAAGIAAASASVVDGPFGGAAAAAAIAARRTGRRDCEAVARVWPRRLAWLVVEQLTTPRPDVAALFREWRPAFDQLAVAELATLQAAEGRPAAEQLGRYVSAIVARIVAEVKRATLVWGLGKIGRDDFAA